MKQRHVLLLVFVAVITTSCWTGPELTLIYKQPKKSAMNSDLRSRRLELNEKGYLPVQVLNLQPAESQSGSRAASGVQAGAD